MKRTRRGKNVINIHLVNRSRRYWGVQLLTTLSNFILRNVFISNHWRTRENFSTFSALSRNVACGNAESPMPKLKYHERDSFQRQNHSQAERVPSAFFQCQHTHTHTRTYISHSPTNRILTRGHAVRIIEIYLNNTKCYLLNNLCFRFGFCFVRVRFVFLFRLGDNGRWHWPRDSHSVCFMRWMQSFSIDWNAIFLFSNFERKFRWMPRQLTNFRGKITISKFWSKWRQFVALVLVVLASRENHTSVHSSASTKNKFRTKSIFGLSDKFTTMPMRARLSAVN